MENLFDGQQGQEKTNYTVAQLLAMGEINDHLTFVNTKESKNTRRRRKGLFLKRKRIKTRNISF